MITIKEIEYNQSDKTLRCEVSGLSSAVNGLTNGINLISNIDATLLDCIKHDDLTLISGTKSEQFQKSNYETILSNSEIKEFKFAPFAHQIDAINFCIGQKRTLLLDSMGVG